MENKIHVPNHQPVVSSTVKMLIQWDAIGIVWISWGYEIWAMFLSETATLAGCPIFRQTHIMSSIKTSHV